MQRSLVYKSRLWKILEYHDLRLRDLISMQIDKTSIKYEIKRKNDSETPNYNDYILKLLNYFPFRDRELIDEDFPLYFTLQANDYSKANLVKELVNSESLSYDPQSKLPNIKLSDEILLLHPEILKKDRIYFLEKIDGEEGEYFLPYGWGQIYQLIFQLQGLRNLWNEITPRSKLQKQFLDSRESMKENQNGKETNISLEDKVKSDFKWDRSQLKAFRKISAPDPFLVLNGFAGSGKTTVLNAGWKALHNFKILVLAHDHKTVNFLMQKYIDANPEVIFYRIGNNHNARQGDMGAYHVKSDNKHHRSQVLVRLDKKIAMLKQTSKDSNASQKNVLEKIEIMQEWRDFLTREEGMELFEKIKFNSARALFCTINGLEYYNKRGLLDCFLPFDYMFLDEASQIDIPHLFHASQFCKANIIAGDKNLVQPYKIADDWRAKPLNAIDELEKQYNKNLPEMFVTFMKQYRMNPKIFSIIQEEMFLEMSAGKPIEILVNDTELFSVRNQEPYIQVDPINFIDTTNLGPKARWKKKINMIEVEIITDLLNQLNDKKNWENPLFECPIRIWITSLYASQVEIIKTMKDLLQ